MRLRHPGGRPIHLNYGTSVHTARNIAEVVAHLDLHATAVRERLGLDVLGLSLWLPPPVARGLARDGRARGRLRTELEARGLEVVTLSGVPYDNDATKADRYRPDWTTVQRLNYTLDLARVLVDLLPEDAVRGSVSTVAFGWRAAWAADQERTLGRMLDRLSAGLTEIAWRTGRAVRVGFQPQPGCAIGTTEHAVTWLSRVDTDRLGVCLDLAALACSWEEPADAVARLAAIGIPIVKARIGAVLEVRHPVAAAAALSSYVEPRYSHQTTNPDGGYADDLDDALRTMPPGPWRVRYELPLHRVPPAPLAATTAVWRSGLAALTTGDRPACDHLDVEAETWDVLPSGQRPGSPAALAEGIAADLATARDAFTSLGLAPAVCAG